MRRLRLHVVEACLVWMALGVVVYFAYSRGNSVLGRSQDKSKV